MIDSILILFQTFLKFEFFKENSKSFGGMFVDVPELIIEVLGIFVLISTFELIIVLFKGIVDK